MSMPNDDLNLDNSLEAALKSDPGYVLPDGFAERIALLAKRKNETRQMFRDFILYISTFLIVAAVFTGTAYVFNPSFFTKFVTLFIGNLQWVASVAVILIFVLFADQVIMPYFQLMQLKRK